MFWKLRVSAVCTLACFATAARAATLNVGPGQTYTTIQSAINAASGGDTVLVAPGTYTENIDFHGKAITVTSSGGPAVTILDGGGTVGVGTVNFVSGELRSSVISNFTIRNGGGPTSPLGPGGGVNVLFAAPTVLNNTITGNECNDVFVSHGAALLQGNTITGTLSPVSGYPCTFPGAGVLISGYANVGNYSSTELLGNTIANNVGSSGGVVLNATQGTVIQGNTIHNNQGNNAGGLYSVNTNSLQVLENVFYGNVNGNFGYGSFPSDISILAPGSTVGPFEGILAGNTITDNLYLEGNLAQIAVVNNLIIGSTFDPPLTCNATDPLAITPPSYDHNDIYNSGGAAFTGPCPVQAGAYGNISADPLFVNAGGNDYRLKANSPAIDAGNNSAPWIASTDIAGSPRIQNGTGKSYAIVDMGAYEFAGQADAGHTDVTLTPSEYFASANPTPAPPPLSFTVALSSAAGQPTGNVSVLEDGMPFGSVAVGSSGSANINGGNLGTGLHAFTATYAAPSASPAAFDTPAVSVKFYLLLPNNLPTIVPTATQFNCSPGTIYATATAVLSATVTTATGTPTGSVNFTDNGTTLGSVPLSSSGGATWNYTSLIAGTHTLTASYSPGSGFAASSATCTETVDAVPTTTTLGIFQASAATGVPVELIAKVTANVPVTGASPTGTVTFDQIFPPSTTVLLLGTAHVGAGGVAEVALPTNAPGIYDIICNYTGDQTFAPSSCPVQSITLGSTGLTLTSSANPAAPGAPITFTAQLTFAGQASAANQSLSLTYTPAGGAAVAVPLTTNGSGAASYTLAQGLPAGNYTFTVSFAATASEGAATASLAEAVTTVNSGPPDFSLTGPGSVTFLTTTSYGAALTLASTGGFAANVALTCSAAIPQYVCSVTPSVALAANGSSGATLTLQWVGLQQASRAGGVRVMLAGLLLLGLFGVRRRRRLFAVLCLAMVACGISACGSAAYPTVVGSFPVTVTATGGGTTHTMTVSAQIVQ